MNTFGHLSLSVDLPARFPGARGRNGRRQELAPFPRGPHSLVESLSESLVLMRAINSIPVRRRMPSLVVCLTFRIFDFGRADLCEA